MPTPTIPAGNLFMNATIYAGTSATQTVTNGSAGASFQPDFIWVKNRTGANDNILFDSNRGSNGSYYYELISNSNVAENYYTAGNYGMVSAINSNGFTLASSNSNWNLSNATGNNYVGWQWKAGGTAVTNTAGSISAQVSANTTSGFSVVTYTGTGANATVGHGLGAAPQFIIVKNRTVAGPNWYCYSLYYDTSIPEYYATYLNLTNARDSAAAFWNNTKATSTVFTVGTSSGVNGSTNAMVAYCWTPIAGYSAFGSYTGNGSTDGPFVYLGFRPKFIMVKRTDSTGDWTIVDTSRNPSNVVTNRLYANLSNAEDTDTPCDALSNGFKVRMTATTWNASGGTYIYAAFAENPFKYANAR